MTKQEFLQKATAAALASSRTNGLSAGVTVAQAVLESNWGQSLLARDAHNYFGIKAHGGGDRVAYPTCEVVNGRTVRVTAEFARYASMEECFADRDRLILSLACYAEARTAKGNPEQFAHALAKHWATEPRYAEKLLAVYRTNGLSEIEQHLHH
jgi:flagellum-specific peptidoglycan hydrolase FlgJ